MTDLKPCPICGRKLTWDDVSYIDDEGYEIYEGQCDRVVLSCESSCGFVMQVNSYDLNYMFGDWQKIFLERVNKRAFDGGMKKCCGNCRHYSEDMCLREFVRDPFHYGNDVCDNWEVKG